MFNALNDQRHRPPGQRDRVVGEPGQVDTAPRDEVERVRDEVRGRAGVEDNRGEAVALDRPEVHPPRRVLQRLIVEPGIDRRAVAVLADDVGAERPVLVLMHRCGALQAGDLPPVPGALVIMGGGEPRRELRGADIDGEPEVAVLPVPAGGDR